MAFEIHDQDSMKKDDPKSSEQRPAVDLDTSVFRQFFYCYNIVGLFTGPYYSYRVHQDMVRCTYLQRIPYANEVYARLFAVPFLVVLFLLLQWICPVEDAHQDWFYEHHGFLFCLLYSAPVFAVTRARLYICWMLAEAACFVSGIGAYPRESKPKIGSGPALLDVYERKREQLDNLPANSDEIVECDYEVIRNIDAYGCEFNDTFRGSMRCWNRSVQYWLATYVYKRCPWRSLRTALTLLVSAYWHGVHVGYYLSFLTIPLCLYAEDLAISRMEKPADGQSQRNEKFRFFWWLFRMRAFEYMVMGFLLLSWTSTVKYWQSTGYFLHVALAIIILVLMITKKINLH